MATSATDRMARNIDRHHDRLRDAIRKQLPNIISREDVVTAPSGQRVRVPVRWLEEPRFRPAQPAEGQGGGGSGAGDAGNLHKDPEIEIELTIDELAQILFDELHLPNLEPKVSEATETASRVEGVAPKGPPARLHVRRSIVEHLRHGGAWREEDLRYRDVRPAVHQVAKAVVAFVRDASGSMDERKRYRARAAAFWALRWLRSQYPAVETVFVIHGTAAEEVQESVFFHAVDMGGTLLSSGLRLAQAILEERYPERDWNRYVLQFSDGENWPQDNQPFLEAMRQIHEGCALVAYCEVQPKATHSSRTVLDLLREQARLPRLRWGSITDEMQVGIWIRSVFGGAQA